MLIRNMQCIKISTNTEGGGAKGKGARVLKAMDTVLGPHL